MGKKNNYRSSSVPWGWVLASAYCTALVCVAVSQITGPEAAIATLREYQTLVAGLATVAALFIAAQQLKRQVDRDAVDARRHYQLELDTLSELDKAASHLARAAGQRPAPYDAALPYQKQNWERLRQQANLSVANSVSSVMREVESYNGLVEPDEIPQYGLTMSLGGQYANQHQFERRRVYLASMLLLAAVRERQNLVLKEIEDAS